MTVVSIILGGGKITVTIDTDRHGKSFCGVQGGFFQKAALAPRRAQNLLASCIFVGVADKSAFALFSAKVTQACAYRRRNEIRKKGVIYKTDD